MRRYFPHLVIWTIALLVTFWPWISMAQALADQQPPLWPLRQVAADGTEVSRDTLGCQDAASYIDGESFWFGPCVIEVDEWDYHLTFVRVSPADGVVDVRWTFPSVGTPEQRRRGYLPRIDAVARNTAGDLFVQSTLYFDEEDGGSETAHAILRPDGLEALPLRRSKRGISAGRPGWAKATRRRSNSSA